MTAKKAKLIPALARLDEPQRKPTKAQRRQAQAWQRKAAQRSGTNRQEDQR